MNYRGQYVWAVVCLVLSICFLIFALFLFVEEAWAGEWSTGRENGNYMAVTVNQSGDSFGLSGKPNSDRYLLAVNPYSDVPYPSRARLQLVISVDGIAIGEKQARVLDHDGSKSYVTFITDNIVAHLMAGHEVNFLILDGEIDPDPIKFKFSLGGSQEALAPLVGQKP